MGSTLTIVPFLKKVDQVILNPLLTLVFAIALLYFFVGVFQFVKSDMADKSREEGKKKILYGLIGMFVMVSAYGLIRIVLGTFGLGTNIGSGFINF